MFIINPDTGVHLYAWVTLYWNGGTYSLLFFVCSLVCSSLLIVCILGPYYLPGPGCRRPTVGSLLSSPPWEPGETEEPIQVCYAFAFLFTSVADPWHFGTNPDPQIRTSEWRIRMRIREARKHTYPDPVADPDPFTSFFKDKVIKKSQNSRNQCFS